jgi:hypothetical protein
MRSSSSSRIGAILATVLAALAVACGGSESGGAYCCRYETRSTGCGGSGWGAWTAETYSFDIDAYVEGWTPERVCNNFTGSPTSCTPSGSCCIYVEYRNNQVSGGPCS